MGMDVSVRVGLTVAVAMVPRRDRVKVDARLFDGRLHLCPIPFRIVARQWAPGLHGTEPRGAVRLRPTRSTLAARRARYASMHRV